MWCFDVEQSKYVRVFRSDRESGSDLIDYFDGSFTFNWWILLVGNLCLGILGIKKFLSEAT